MRDVEALVELLVAEDDTAERAARALVRVGPPLAARVAGLWDGAPPRARARLVRILGRIADPQAVALVLRATGDSDPKTRRHALGELGRVRVEGAEATLLEAWATESDLPTLRTVAEALGKLGSPAALEALRRGPPHGADDAELGKRVARATQMASRDLGRHETSAVDVDARFEAPLEVVLFCRPGLQSLLAEEARDLGARAIAPGEVAATLDGPLSRLFRSRLWTSVGLALAPEPVRGDLAEAVARSLASARARALFTTFTRGSLRYRLSWEGGGHRRAIVWQIAERVQALAPALTNDPRESTWEVLVRHHAAKAEQAELVSLLLCPRRMHDPRFSYRTREVPAASHPTIAAALAFVGGALPTDVVWDPFVGSGLELVERARLGPSARLLGTDVDPEAIAAATENLRSANVEAELAVGDAFTTELAHRYGRVTLILTNPPMGRRVQSQGALAPFLEGFVDHAATTLGPGGRLAWISPKPKLTRARAEARGMSLVRATPLLMGTQQAELQLFRRLGG